MLWAISIENTKLLLKTFTYLDLINIVVFDEEAMSLGGDYLITADNRFVKEFEQRLVDHEIPEGNVVVDYGKAISKAFSIFAKTEERTEKGEPGSIHGCQKVGVGVGSYPQQV